jgi:hypothetical protein
VDCPARPVRVSCSITGETWEASEVTDVEVYPRETLVMVSTYDVPRILAACRARWAGVKALVLGLSTTPALSHCQGLVAQRDEVYAGLADLAQLERGACNAQQRVEGAFPYHRFHRVGGGDHHAAPPSHARLAAYVDFLVEQVGALP